MLNDAAIRAHLRAFVREASSPTDLLVEELGLCEHSVRADVALLGASFHGYEIKGETDSLIRLPVQLEVYRQVFDRVTLVVAERLVAAAEKIAPRWCGIVIAQHRSPGDVALRSTRPARAHCHVDSAALVQLLWREEALGLLQEIGEGSGMHAKPRVAVWQRLVDALPLEHLRPRVLSALAERSAWPPSIQRS